MADKVFYPDEDDLDEGAQILRTFDTPEEGGNYLKDHGAEYTRIFDFVQILEVYGHFNGEKERKLVPCLVAIVSIEPCDD